MPWVGSSHSVKHEPMPPNDDDDDDDDLRSYVRPLLQLETVTQAC